jgi:hypothetical protein
MTRKWLSRLTFAALVATVFAACEVPEYGFVEDEAHCNNGVLDFEQGETGIDCAGDCQPCGDGEPCYVPADCAGEQCFEGSCLGESCGNDSADGNETGVDCGGDCEPCTDGEPCVEPSDCASGVCTGLLCQPPSCSDDFRNGEETGEDCGGGSCNPCPAGEPCKVDTDCASMVCSGELVCEVSCAEGTAECDGDFADACETNTFTDANHCGECGAVCDLEHAAEAGCSGGVCRVITCEEPFAACDTSAANGCEIDTSTDTSNCGECNRECPAVNGTPDCVKSRCLIDCDDGFDDCDDNVGTGCETSTARDTQNCGSCQDVCPRGEDDEEPWCKAGECGSTDCPEDRGDCDGDDTCDVNLTNDPDNCNTCGTPCVVAQGKPSCTARVCGIKSCNEGYGNCDADAEDGGYENGCETNTLEDENNCGGCGIVCEIENATATCDDGRCVVKECDAPFADCDGDGLDCEVNTDTASESCGSCSTDCNEVLANATGKCAAGACEVLRCTDGYADCTSANGCETLLADSDSNCGTCGTECVDRGGTNDCNAGACTPACAAPFFDCDTSRPNGCESNTQTDEQNCGACGIHCLEDGTLTNECMLGECTPRCDDAHLDCDSDPADGCETDKLNDKGNCGECGKACSAPAGTTANECVQGFCTPVCAPNRGDCDSEPEDGCEESFLSNPDHCGQCDRKCASGGSTHATSSTCSSSGVCQPVCQANFDDCDSPWLGCTTDLRLPSSCGACGVVCSGATPACVGTNDVYRCQAPITLATGDAEGQIAGPLLTFSHTLQAGTNRVLLLAISADSPGGNVSANKPEIVNYGSTPMLFAAEQSGMTASGDQWWGADLYIYYLAVADSVNGSATTVTIDARGGTAPTALVANLVQLNGVHQAAPIARHRGATDRTSLPRTVTTTLSVTTAGSRIYSFAAGLWSPIPSYSVTPQAGSVIQTLNSPVVPSTGDPQMRAVGLYVGDNSSSALGEGDHAVTWDFTGASVATHLSVVIEPAVAE